MDELRTGLELATEAELKQLTQILFARGFNPLDYWKNPLPAEVQSQDWQSWVDSLEKRFRYLAADSLTVIQGRSEKLSYRQILIQVCNYLTIDYSQSMSTTEIEAEIFLYIVGKTDENLARSSGKKDELLNICLKGGTVWAINSIVKKTVITRGIARYTMMRTAIGMIGPMLWASLIAELGWKAIATNYRRILPVIITLAQIRLIRSECWELA